jgi:hypothetical protein
MKEPQTPPGSDADIAKREAMFRRVLIVTGVILAFQVFGLVGLSLYFQPFKKAQLFKSLLEPKNGQVLELRAAEEKILTTYRLLDPEKRTFQIPIRRAMELLAEEASRQGGKVPQP